MGVPTADQAEHARAAAAPGLEKIADFVVVQVEPQRVDGAARWQARRLRAPRPGRAVELAPIDIAPPALPAPPWFCSFTRCPNVGAHRLDGVLVDRTSYARPWLTTTRSGGKSSTTRAGSELIIATDPDDAQRPMRASPPKAPDWPDSADRTSRWASAASSSWGGKSSDVGGGADEGGVRAAGVRAEVQLAAVRREERCVDVAEGGAPAGPQSQLAQQVDAGPDGAARGHGGHPVGRLLVDRDGDQRRPRIVVVALSTFDAGRH